MNRFAALGKWVIVLGLLQAVSTAHADDEPASNDSPPATAAAASPPANAASDAAQALIERLAAEEPAEPDFQQDPIGSLIARMRKAESRLTQSAELSPTREVQASIVRDLQSLLDAAKKNRQQGGSNSGQSKQQSSQRQQVQQPGQGSPQGNSQQQQPGNPSNAPATSAQATNRPAGQAEGQAMDADAMRSMVKDLWGNLPQHQREQVLNASFEAFLPRYEWQIEQYFKRLSELQGERP